MHRNSILTLASVLTFNISMAQKPNIVLILTDDMGFSDVGCYGGNFAPTPNIDKMAREGVKFTQYYSSSPICSPSRTGILTGMAPARWNITSYLHDKAGNGKCEQADFLDSSAPSIARTMKTAGYTTGHFGKWHMGGGRDVTEAPGFKAYGFDEHSSTYESPDPDPLLTATDWIWSGQDSIKRWNRTAYFVDRTLDFLKRHKGTPCYVNLWPDDVHTPWVPSQERFEKYPKGTAEEIDFKAVLDEYDHQMGRLFAGLKQLEIDENTLVVFTSDNGPMPSFKGSRSGNYRGSKASLYEGGTRLPFIVRWPGHTPEGKVDQQSVLSANDFFPSLCALAGAKMPTGFAFDGKEKSSVFLGKPSDESRTLYWEYGRNNEAFSFAKGRDRNPNLAIRDGNWKLLMNFDGTSVELYDMVNDFNETKNLALVNPKMTDKLQAKLLAWRNSMPKLPVSTK
ncbi:MAG: sulfatase-like hydrolase/transferase [Mariniphaga sp.]|nr:sulfatase-like hydrolase/transferase [Mariniphaga sp.]